MKFTSIIFFLILFLKCGSSAKEDFSIKIDSNSKKLTNNDSIFLTIKNKKNHIIDSVHFFLNEQNRYFWILRVTFLITFNSFTTKIRQVLI